MVAPSDTDCIICSLHFGYWVGYQPWHTKFRALYRGQYGVGLTGIGYTWNDREYRVPYDERERWDTTDDLILLIYPPFRIWDVYLFHEKCWDNLMEHIDGAEFDLDSLYEALESFPRTKCPWRFQWHDGHESFDIFIVPTLEQLMQSPRVCPLPTRHLATLPRSPTDHFSALPVELLEAIAVDLPTSDVLRLRLIARAMAPIFTSKVFWKSRFSINGERGFLRPVIQQEIEGNGGKDVDWRLLYHCTCKLKCSLEFDYQIRIWESLRWLRDATLARCSNKRKQQGSVPVLQCDLPLDFRGRALQGYHNAFYPNTHKESVHLVRPLKRMIVMVLQIDGIIYITGLEFIFDGMPNVLIGYKTPGAVIIDSSTPGSINRSMYKYPGIRFTTEISCLTGFSIDISPGGVHLIKVIQEDITYYFGGYSDTMEHQECDLRLDEVMEVVGTFDVSSGPSFYEQLDFILIVCKQHCKMLDLGFRGRGERKDRDGKDRWDKMVWRRRRMRRGIY